jgi:hypothetical protein
MALGNRFCGPHSHVSGVPVCLMFHV